MTALKTLIAGAVLAACFAGPSFAQDKSKDLTPMQLDQQAKDRDRASVDQAYRSALQKTRANEAARADDPWANIRGEADVKPKARR